MQRREVAILAAVEAETVPLPTVSRRVWRQVLLFGIGLLGLAAGFLYYAMVRRYSPGLVQDLVGDRLFGLWPWLMDGQSQLASFPSFIHVFTFSILTVAGCGRPGMRPCLAAAGLWTAINVFFECLQGIDHEAFVRFMAGLSWRMEALTAFVTGGVFDWGDVWAAVSGGTVAFVLSAAINGKGVDHDA